MPRTFGFAPLALLLASLVPAAAHAAPSLKLWGGLTYVAPLSETDRTVNGVSGAVKASNELGFQLGGEFRSGSLGLALDYLQSRHELSQSASGLSGSADFHPISASLLLHLPLPLLDLYGGPTASYVNWGDLELQNGTKQSVDPKFGLGFTVGADLPLAPMIAVGGSMRWLKVEAETSGVGAVSVDPLISTLGMSVRF
jgi:hypothetical protein